ncbi:DMT family transporter [Labrys okinawensis]|uniref:DMT family transporter n=1 Tax=Labrys okinawensis TaxID=346911 RepID=UPI0039BCAFE8
MSRMLANCLLLLAAALWGFGNVAQKTVLEHLDPFSAVGSRCLIGGLLVMPLLLMERRWRFGPGHRASLVRLSALFSIAIVLQQAAYLTTTVTNASFLVNTCTVMTPVAAWLVIGEKPTLVVAFAASLTLIGILLLSGGLSGTINSGDMAALLSAVCYALWMVELSRHMQNYGGAVSTAIAQFLSCAIVALPLGVLYGNFSLQSAWAAAPELAVLGIFSTAVAFGIQTIAQRFTPASHAAVIVSGESVFGATGAVLFLGESLSVVAALGGTMVLVAIVYLAIAGQPREAAGPAAAS